MRDQAFEPSQLVIEFRPRPRVAVGQVDRGDEEAGDRRLDVAGRVVVGVGQAAPSASRSGIVPLARMATPIQLR